MKQTHIKTPPVFRFAVALLFAMILSFHCMGGLYARYSTSATDTTTARVAKISYAINGSDSARSLVVTADLGNQGSVIAVEESFTIFNDGEVAYDYSMSLSLTDQNSNGIAGYSLGAPAQNVFMLSASSKTNLPSYTPNGFYYKKNSNSSFDVSDAPRVSGTLNVGEADTYTILYFINLTQNSETGLPSGVLLGKQVTLNYAVTCTQIN